MSTNYSSIANNSVDGWTEGLGVNTWSWEGTSDGTYFLTPFIQKHIDKASNLADGTYQKSYTPTENGFYKVNAWVRLFKESGGQTTYSGATMFAGSNSVSVCSGGTLYNSNKAYLGSYSVKIVGTKDVAFNYGFTLSSANFNWLSFKNITIEKVATLDKFADALPGSAVTAGLWYKFTTGSSSDAYTLSSSGDATITYTTDGTLTDDTGVTDTWTLHAKQNVLLAPSTTYYVKSNAAVTLTKSETSVNSSYVSGWTKVTSISELQTNPEDYFFAIFSANNTGLMLGASGNYSDTQKPCYKTAANPLSSTAYLFEIENYDGAFVLKSSAISKYFKNTSGGPWNYHATETSTSSDCKTTITLANGVYTLQTANADGGTGNYLGLWYANSDNKGYVDGEILAGNKQATAKGSFLIYRIRKNDLDMTALITNPDFSAATWSDGWTGTGSTKAEKFADQSGNGSFTGHFAEMWVSSGSKMSAGNIYQTIKELPAGAYTLTAKVQAGIACKLYATVGGADQYTEYTGAVKTVSLTFTVATTGDVVIGLKHDGVTSASSDTWVAVDDFTLTNATAMRTDYAALSAAITAYDAATWGFESGEYAPYNNVTAIENITAAKAINSSAINTKSTVNSLTDALELTVNDGEVNAIYNPTFALSTDNMTAIGWDSDDETVIGNESGEYHSRALVGNANLAAMNGTKSALYLRYDGTNSNVSTIYSYGNVAGYTMPLKAGTIYRFKADAAVWSTDGTQWHKDLRVAILNSSSTEVAGQTLTTPNSSMGGGSTDKISYDFLFCPAADGNYTLTVDNMAETSTGIVISNFELKKATSQTLTLPSAIPYAAGTYPSVTLSRTFSAENWGTLCVPFAFDASSFAEVKELSTISVNGENVSMTFADVAGTTTAGKPYLVKAANNGDGLTVTNVALPGTDVQESSATASGYTVNYVGTYTGASLTSSNSDAWIVKNSLLYNVDSDVTVGAYRAYFTVTAPSPVKGMFFDMDGETCIGSIENETMRNGENEKIFNLAGQRVSKAQKGIYIIDGKKVVIK